MRTRFILFLAISAAAFGAELVIPNQSPVGWVPGTDVGVPGGIAQYRPGGANQRINLRNVVTEFGADNTGSLQVQSAVNAGISSLNHNDVLYFPYGLYKTTSQISLGTKRITVRGAGDGKPSTSSVTIGTGTKVFTVEAGLGWTAGVGIRIWHTTNRYKWMQGTVTSYSGTTLTVNITLTSGHTDTLAFWTVGQTVFYRVGANLIFEQTDSGDPLLGQSTTIEGSPAANDSQITVTDGSVLWNVPSMVAIDMLPETNGELYNHGPYLRGVHRMYNWVTSVVGNTVTLAKPLPVGLPVARVPKIYMRDSYVGAYNVGYEDFAAFGDNTSAQYLFNFGGQYASWFYHVQMGFQDATVLSFTPTVACEIAFCFIGTSANDVDPSASAITMGGTNFALVRDSVIHNGMVTENRPDFNNAFLRNVGLKDGWAVNHGFGNKFRLYEHNIVGYFKFDGYHGGYMYETVFRNWIDGSSYGSGKLPGQGYLIYQRYGRYNNSVGNVLGKSGVAWGGISEGNPNINNGDSTYTLVGETPANPTLYVTSGGASGSQFRHVDPTGFSRLAGTLTAKSGTQGTITLTSHTIADLAYPYFVGNNTLHVIWGSLSDEATQNYRRNMNIVRASSSGANVVMDDGISSAGSALPAVSTPVWILPGESGTQELDGAVAYTAFKKQNYEYTSNGASGAITDATTDTLPDSLAETGAPADWPTGVIAWPPAIDTSNPNALTYAVIPAGFFVQNGYWPSSTSAPSGGSGTMTVTNTTATNITVP
jgi:hypothetical protein